jgi:hypothetical protein
MLYAQFVTKFVYLQDFVSFPTRGMTYLEMSNEITEARMSHLPTLLKRHESLVRELARLEGELADVRAQILGRSDRVALPSKPRRVRATHAQVVEVVRDTIKVLRDADGPLPRKEIAARLGITPRAAGYRLRKATAAKFIENVGSGRYRVTNVVPAF